MASVASSPADNPDWLVGNPTFVQQSAALWIGSVGLLILGLQPVLLGAMFTEGRVNFDELALIATAEFVMIAIGSAISGMLLSARHLRLKSAVLLIALAVLNYAMSFAATPNDDPAGPLAGRACRGRRRRGLDRADRPLAPRRAPRRLFRQPADAGAMHPGRRAGAYGSSRRWARMAGFSCWPWFASLRWSSPRSFPPTMASFPANPAISTACCRCAPSWRC